MDITAELKKVAETFKFLDELPLDEKIKTINEIKLLLRERSPFKDHPVDCVRWIKADDSITSNDYNPNHVADPELKLLELSLLGDGFTQPVVTIGDAKAKEIVDGFHRTTLVKTQVKVSQTTHGYIPTVSLTRRMDKESRMASTIRHNRARGAHSIEAMSKIVQDLKRRGWSDEKVGRELGMEPDEVLRLNQTVGLAELYQQRDYSFAWEPEDKDVS